MSKAFYAALEQAVIGMVTISTTGKFIYINPAYAQLLGYSQTELQNLSFQEITHPDDLDLDLGHFEQLLAGQIKGYAIDKRYLNKAGQIIWVHLTVSLVSAEQDQAAFIFSQVEDITARKRQEQRQLDVQQRMHAAQRLSHLGAWELDLRTGQEIWSDEFFRICGLIPGSIAEPSYQDRSKLMHPDDNEHIVKIWEEAYKTGQPYQLETRIIRPDGEIRYLLVKAEFIKQKGEITHVRGTCLDITSSSQYKQELLRSNQELERFAYVASHDLQEPLRKILVFGQYLAALLAEKLSPKEADYFERIQKSAEHMQTLTNDLLAYSRLDSHKKTFVIVDLNEILAHTLEVLELSIEESQAQIKADRLPVIMGDPPQLKQIFLNLLSNALKFKAPNRPVRIQIQSQELDLGQLKLSFIDNGIGFPPLHQKQIFDIFKRLHVRSKYEGSGIGLSICKKIAERHGGILSATGSLDQGARFDLILPRPTNQESQHAK